jgi:nicotinamidase-related amidase
VVTEPNLGTRLLDRSECALVVIDLQSKLLPAIFESERVVRNSQLLLRLAQVLKIPALLTTQYARGLGDLVKEIAEAVPGAGPMDKTSFGCFGDATFLHRLKEIAPRARTLLVAGVESHICVAQTALGALDAGFLVHVAGDATSSRSSENWQAGLKRMERAGAVISSTEMMIYELLGQSGTWEFKTMLPLLR